MKRFMAVFTIVMLMSVMAMAQFTGPSGTPATVAEARKMSHDTYVTLTGTIDKHIRYKEYQFSDATGSITVEIDKHHWHNFAAGPEDTVTLSGKLNTYNNIIYVKQLSK